LKEHDVSVGIGTLWRFFKRRKIARKKDGACRNVAARWGQLDLDPTRIVFIDETAANIKMARLLRLCAPGRPLSRRRASRPLESHHFHRCSAPRRNRRAHGVLRVLHF
jgi:hypothetical protein